jgi:hypothetical protein
MNRTKTVLLGCMVLSQPLCAQDVFTYQQQIEKISHQIHAAQSNHDYNRIEQLTEELKSVVEKLLKEQLGNNNQDQDKKKWSTLKILGAVWLSIVGLAIVTSVVGLCSGTGFNGCAR